MSVSADIRNRRHWESLRQYLFGGNIALPIGEDPHKAVDFKTNPPLTVWMPGWVITQDEGDLDSESPFKPFPQWEYLELLAEAWVYEPLLFVPKSRQLMVTWLFMAIASHEIIARPGSRTAIISKKFKDVNEGLLERVQVILSGLPGDQFHVPQVIHSRSTGIIRCQERNSSIHALSEDAARDSRGWTFSWIFSDEFDFQEYAEEQYRAALATIKGKRGSSRYTAVSTPDGKRLFYDIVTDKGTIPVPAGV